MRQICEGVEYMHQNNVVHLDLKPENIMCRTRTSHQIKLIDFGLAQTLKPDTPIRVLFGTPEFIPPEIISYEPIGTESDMWSVGVICYVLLTGLSPFMGDNDAETFANITRADYDLDDEAFDAISNNAKDFISGLLVKRKESRMSARQCLEHPWMAQHAETMSRIALPTDKLKKFIVRRKWQKTGNAIRALGRMAILSANSRKISTASAEYLTPFDSSIDTTIDSTNSDEKEKSLDSSTDTNSLNDSINEVEENSLENGRRKSSLYSFCCKTEINITLNEETEDKISKEDEISSTIHSTSLNGTIETKQSVLNCEESMGTKMAAEENEEIQENVKSEEINEDIQENLRSEEINEVIQENIRSEEINEEIKSSGNDSESSLKSQSPRRVFRGDSRDSGIGDCSSNLATSSLQLDELGIVSIIEEETDSESSLKSSKDVASTTETLERSTNREETEVESSKESKGSTEGIEQSSIIKALRDTNRVHEDTDESQDARLISSRNREKFVPTGNVSRKAKIFEQEAAALKSSTDSQIQLVHRAYPATTMATGKPHNERIQRAFAFWNK